MRWTEQVRGELASTRGGRCCACRAAVEGLWTGESFQDAVAFNNCFGNRGDSGGMGLANDPNNDNWCGRGMCSV
jgi:hypothetical protein